MLHALAATDPATTAWLTEALRAANILPSGAVIACESRANDAFNSMVSHLTLTYSADAPSDAPRRLFLKRNLADAWAVEAGRDEVVFYQAMARHRDRLPMLIPCYAALVDETRGAPTLLMPDVSVTHAPPLLRADQISYQVGLGSSHIAQSDVSRVWGALPRSPVRIVDVEERSWA